MNFATASRTLGMLLVLYHEGLASAYGETALIAVLAGLLMWLPLRSVDASVRPRDGFLVVALLWVAMSLMGSVPFILTLDISFINALFESTSGYTTTGATVLNGLDTLPRSILFYRQEIQWFGGVGVVVLAIAMLPMLGIGGMQLYKAETPGPFKDERLTPRIARTARNIWLLYAAFTVACAMCFYVAGMDPFDAIAHSLSTLSTGGYSTHDASLGFFNSPAIESVALVFMLIGAISFSTHFVFWRTLRLSAYRQDAQILPLLGTVILVSGAIAGALYHLRSGDSFLHDLRIALFEVVSVLTSTGFGIEDFSAWPLALPVILIFVSFIGGCAGSTAGGLKVIRLIVLGKQLGVHIRHLIHPKSIWPVKLGGRVVPDSVIDSIWGFFTIYVVIFAALMMALMFDGMDQVSAFSAVATSLNNLGPGLGSVATNFLDVSGTGKLLIVLSMLLGRLEIFTLIVLFAPSFWRD